MLRSFRPRPLSSPTGSKPRIGKQERITLTQCPSYAAGGLHKHHSKLKRCTGLS